ncbi:MAG: hypothetical protein HN704_18280 [Bacteroidetes bacterium]|jgi:hypothetical protein|nr:hypothetical protein [Bacteroidota bacterium]MBT7493551.1 hypothetical protein [Bacteroidota bacterium]
MQFKDLNEKQTQEEIDNFLNDLVLSLRIKDMTEKELLYISDKLIKWVSGSVMYVSRLKQIRTEIVKDYKKYLPFCYASLITAYHKRS